MHERRRQVLWHIHSTDAPATNIVKTGYTTYWTPEKSADLKSLKEQHNRCFPGNELAIVEGYVKVAVMDGEKPPLGATTVMPKQAEVVISGNVTK